MKNYSVNSKIAPREFVKFAKWHAKACEKDPLTAEKRFAELCKIWDKNKIKYTPNTKKEGAK